VPRLPPVLRAYAADARAAVAAAPVEVALGVLLAAALSASFRSDAFAEDGMARLAASVALAFPVVLAVSAAAARGVLSPAARWGATAAALALAGLYGAVGFDPERSAAGWRWAALAASAVLLLLGSAALPWRRRDPAAVWAFAARLLTRTAGIVLYAGALFLLLAGAVAAVVSLFELSPPRHLYGDLAGWIFFALAPLILVGGLRRLVAPPEPGVPPAVALLGRWLYAPAVVVYLAILYAYGLKIAVTGELPRNLLSPLVIAAALIGLLGGALLHPVHADAAHRSLSRLVRAVPALVLPLVPLALWGLLARLREYGWTEFRYLRLALVVALGCLALAGTVRLLRRRPPLLAAIPLGLAAVLALSALGPWSAMAVSRRDQSARLRTALAAAGVDPARSAADTTVVDDETYARIDAPARYLRQAHGPEALLAVVPGLPRAEAEQWDVGHAMGLRRACARTDRTRVAIEWGQGVSVVSGGRLQEVEVHVGREAEAAGVRLRLERDRLHVHTPDWSAEGAHGLGAALPRSACEAPLPGDGSIPAAEARLELRDAAGTLRAEWVTTSAEVGTEGAAWVRGLLVVP
jgi:hypothetical protein